MSAIEVNDERDAWFTPMGLATFLSISLRTVRRMIAEGKVRSAMVEGRRRIDPDSVDEYLRERSC